MKKITFEIYKEAFEMAEANLLIIHPVRLNVIYYLSEFYYNFLNDEKSALNLLNKAFNDSIA